MIPQYELELHIRNYCGRDLLAILQLATQKFPNARVLVLGYYPALSHLSRAEGVESLYSLVHGVKFAPLFMLIFSAMNWWSIVCDSGSFPPAFFGARWACESRGRIQAGRLCRFRHGRSERGVCARVIIVGMRNAMFRTRRRTTP